MGRLLLLLLIALLFFSSTAISRAQRLETYTHEYSTFDQSLVTMFNFSDDAGIANGALQITPDSIAEDIVQRYNKSGRVFLPRAFRLWQGRDGPNNTTGPNSTAAAAGRQREVRVASFNTSFLINIYPVNNTVPGEGLAFLIAPDMSLPGNSSGQFLGLTNASTDGSSTNRIVAVELDTFKQDFDPDGDHIGINVNGVRSLNTASLADRKVTLASSPGRFFNVWVDYSGSELKMEVYFAEQMDRDGPTPPKPDSPILTSDLNLMEHVAQLSYFGFAASTGDLHTQLNCVRRWNMTVRYFPDGKGKGLAIGLGVGIPVSVLLIVGISAMGYYYMKRRNVLSAKFLKALQSLPGMPREFEFKELKKATGGFDERNKLGQGGYGVVYKGVLAKEGLEIAVKCFSRESIKGQDDFLAELTIINRLRHKHLVRLLGWCHKNGKLLLVYEYMPNGSLDKHLFAGPDAGTLSWDLRCKVVSGVASALHYLHDEYDQSVVHRDLKASNIMLDAQFNARLGDFGLARALDNDKTWYAEAEGVLGTMGYIAPECFHTGKATKQSDVYAFGAVVLEIVCGQRPGAKVAGFNFLVDWVWFLHRDGRLLEAVDQRLGDDEFVAEEAERLLRLGLACSHPMADERPKTHAVLQMVQGTVEVPVVPPFKPPFIWAPVGPLADLNSGSVDSVTMSTSQFGGSGWSGQYLSRESYAGYRGADSLV